MAVALAFHHAKGPLAQAGVGVQGQAQWRGKGLGRVQGALQVAADHQGQALIAQGLRQARSLGLAQRIQADVGVALDAPLHIPRGLTVADQDDA